MPKKGRSESEVSIACVIGHPVSHSISPRIFGFLSEKLREPITYRRMDVSPKDLKRAVEFAKLSGLFLGWNVTIPHKECILPLLDEVTPEAKAVGAANVVHFAGGRAVGHNTDVQGVVDTLKLAGFRARGASAWILGAGGAARATAYALATLGVESVWISNRTPARARKIATEFSKLFPKTSFEVLRPGSLPASPVNLLAQTTPVGMVGIRGTLEFPAGGYREDALAFDVVYKPLVTPFLAEAKRRGLRVAGGIDMLIGQALRTWEIWFEVGKIPGRSSLRTGLKGRLT